MTNSKQIIVGTKDPAAYILAVAFATQDGSPAALVARGQEIGKAVDVAMKAARCQLAVRPTVAFVGEEAHPDGGVTTNVRIPLDGMNKGPSHPRPDGKPIIVGGKQASAYAVAMMTRLKTDKCVLVRARHNAPISTALTAACLAARLGYIERPQSVSIGEETDENGRTVPFVEFAVSAARRRWWQRRAS